MKIYTVFLFCFIVFFGSCKKDKAQLQNDPSSYYQGYWVGSLSITGHPDSGMDWLLDPGGNARIYINLYSSVNIDTAHYILAVGKWSLSSDTLIISASGYKWIYPNASAQTTINGSFSDDNGDTGSFSMSKSK